MAQSDYEAFFGCVYGITAQLMYYILPLTLQKLPQKQLKVKVDDRFKAMFTDKRFRVTRKAFGGSLFDRCH